MLTQHLPDESATRDYAHTLAGRAGIRQAHIVLQGDLGAGKTTFARYLLQALGVEGRVKSPTYTVVEPYELAQGDIWHFDFYRFQDPSEFETAGFREIFVSPGLKLVEWADKAQPYLPSADLTLALIMLPDESRNITATAHTPLGEGLL